MCHHAGVGRVGHRDFFGGAGDGPGLAVSAGKLMHSKQSWDSPLVARLLPPKVIVLVRVLGNLQISPSTSPLSGEGAEPMGAEP